MSTETVITGDMTNLQELFSDLKRDFDVIGKRATHLESERDDLTSALRECIAFAESCEGHLPDCLVDSRRKVVSYRKLLERK